MKIIKRRIKQKLKLVSIDNQDNNYHFIPDIDANYNIKIELNQENNNLGYFEPYNDIEYTQPEFESGETFTVTGYSSSRLAELKKHNPDTSIENGYWIRDLNGLVSIRSTGISNRTTGLSIRGRNERVLNGVSLSESNDDNIVYYIDDIRYVDNLLNSTTIFKYIRDVTNNLTLNYLNLPIIKNEKLMKLIDMPKTVDKINIDRNNKIILKNIYWLDDVNNLVSLTEFGGNYYNIKNNI